MKRALGMLAGAALAAGCAAPAPAPQPVAPPPLVQQEPGPPSAPPAPAEAPLPPGAARYRCNPGVALVVRFAEEAVQVQGLPQGDQTLLLDAGGVTPQNRVFSNPRLRMEVGAGADGREAVLHPLEPPGPELRCVRD